MSSEISVHDPAVRPTNAQLMESMLQKRFQHARNQRKDYSHLFRSKTRWELVRLTSIIVGIQFTYAAETAFVSPILLSIGFSHTFMTMMWAIAPAMGFFFAPLIAIMSDQIRLEWGRRRPVLLMLGIGLVLGLLILPHGRAIGLVMGDDDVPAHEASGFRWVVYVTALGLILTDFNVETINGIGRTYFIDMCIKEDHPKVLTVAMMIGGLGGFTGYMLGSVDWSETYVGIFLGSNEATVFAALVIVVLVGLVVTLTSFREVPLELLEKDELLRPISKAAFQEEKRRQWTFASVSNEISTISESVDEEEIRTCPEEEAEKRVTWRTFFVNLFKMPKALIRVYLTQFLSHLGFISYCLYFTDFVAREVFGGDVTAELGSFERNLYEKGVRFGCLGMAVFIMSSSLYSMVIEKVIKFFSSRSVYIGGLLINCVGMMLIAIFRAKFAVFVCSITMGIKYATMYSLPFLLISQYHTKNSFKVSDGRYIESSQKRGFCADVSMLSSMLFLAQVIISLSIGSVIDAFGTSTIVVYSSSLFSCLAAFSATQVVYMDL